MLEDFAKFILWAKLWKRLDECSSLIQNIILVKYFHKIIIVPIIIMYVWLVQNALLQSAVHFTLATFCHQLQLQWPEPKGFDLLIANQFGLNYFKLLTRSPKPYTDVILKLTRHSAKESE